MRGFLFVFSIICLVVLAGCNQDDMVRGTVTEPGKPDEDGLVLVKFRVTVPGPSLPQSRAMTEANEYAIETIDLLLFSGSTLFAHSTGEDVAQDDSDSKIYTFKSYIEKEDIGGGRQFQAVVLANLRSEINALITDGVLTEGVEKEELLGQIQFDLPQTGWMSISGTNFRHLPMWGESRVETIPAQAPVGDAWDDITLLRAVARVDVGVNYTSDAINSRAEGLDNFTLKEVWVYNVNRKGAAVPGEGTYNATLKRVTTPTIPEGMAAPYARLVMAGNTTPYLCTTGEYEIARSIYLPEFNLRNVDAQNTQAVPCIIIGGRYGSASVNTYYRIDFYNPAVGNNEWMDLLRNHRYRINITHVGGPGYDSAAEAFVNDPMNMDGDIIPWNENDLNETTTNGIYSLSVSRSSLVLYKEATTSAMLDIQTSAPKGWTVEYPVNSWFTVTPESGTGEDRMQLVITPKSEHTSGVGARESTFYIKAGDLRKAITVTQLNTPTKISIEVNPEVLEFVQDGYNHKTVSVVTNPPSLVREIWYEGNSIDWYTGYDPDDYNRTVFTEMKIRPRHDQLERTAHMIISVKDEDSGQDVAKIVTIRVLDEKYNFAKGLPSRTQFPYEGGSGFVTVTRSDLPFFIFAATGKDDVLAPYTEYAAISTMDPPVNAEYTVLGNPLFVERTATLQFGSSNANFPDGHNFTITQELNPNVRLVVTRLNGEEVTDASSYVLDFGTDPQGTATQNYSFKANCDLKVTLDANQSNVFTHSGSTSVTGPGSALVFGQERTNTVTPKLLGRAGIYSSTITLTTQNHGMQPSVIKKIVVKKTEKAYFNSLKISETSGPSYQHTITATATTNTKWRVRNVTSGTVFTSSGNDTSTANGKITITITANPDGWDAARTCTFQSSYMKEDGTWTNWENMTATYEQTRYTFTRTVSSTATIPQAGELRTVDISGSCPGGTITCTNGRISLNGGAYATSVTLPESMNTSAKITLSPNAYTSFGADRDVVITYTLTGNTLNDTWTQLHHSTFVTVNDAGGNAIRVYSSIKSGKQYTEVSDRVRYGAELVQDNAPLFGAESSKTHTCANRMGTGWSILPSATAKSLYESTTSSDVQSFLLSGIGFYYNSSPKGWKQVGNELWCGNGANYINKISKDGTVINAVDNTSETTKRTLFIMRCTRTTTLQ